MSYNNEDIVLKQQEESYDIAVKTVSISMLFVVFSLIMVSSGVMGIKNTQLLLSIIIFLSLTCLLVGVVWILKIRKPWVKYALIVVLASGVSYINIFCRMNKLNTVWLYAVVIASLFFSTKTNWFSMVFQLAALTISDYIAVTYFPENFDGTTPWFVLAVSNGIQFIVMGIFCIAVGYRAKVLVRKMEEGKVEQKKMVDRLSGVIESSSSITSTLNGSITQISATAAKSRESNNKIAKDAESLIASFEETLEDMDFALRATEFIMEKHSGISGKGRNISDIFVQEDTMNDSVEVIVDNAVKLMQSIEDNTGESMKLIELIHENSLGVMNTLALINGTVKKINTLALNAYIEASRAGDYQSGFEVVAHDIRKLGERASNESQMILKLTKDTISEIEFAYKSIQDDISGIHTGQETIKRVEELFKKASAENKNVNTRIQEVSSNIEFIADSEISINELVRAIKELNIESITELNRISGLNSEQKSAINELISFLKGLETVSEELKSVINES